MSPQKIQCDYDKLAEIMDAFGREADQTCRLLQAVQQCVSALQAGGWIGRGAETFFAEMSDLVFPGLSRLGNALGDASSAIRRIAELLHSAEEEAARAIQAGGAVGGSGPRYGDTMTGGASQPISLTRDQETLMSNVANALRSGDQAAATNHWASLVRSLSTGAGGIGEPEVSSLIRQTLTQAGQGGGGTPPASTEGPQLMSVVTPGKEMALHTISGIGKALHDSAMDVIRNLRA